ncbi:MAG: TetR/AcrR family transcriptional regulator [Clostridia bacterium]|nr:TetR/AcrR family transcriptional regulator [Clostridia bacterium]
MERNEQDSIKAAILATAARLFREKGVQGASIGDIADAVDISKGTVYYYFKAKSDIVAAVADRHMGAISDVMFDWVNSLDRSCGKESVLALFDTLVGEAVDAKLHCALLAYSACSGELAQLLNARYREWRIMLEVGSLKMASPVSERVRSLSDTFFVLVDGYMLQNNAGVPGRARQQIELLTERI